MALKVFRVKAKGKGKLKASINCADGKVRNLGRVDRKWFGVYVTPRAWYYKHVTYPRLKRLYPEGRPMA